MKTIQTALIKGEQRIDCNFYEVEEHCKRIVTEYCTQSEENQKEFSKFSEHYLTYRPYFDFVICRLHYSLLNPEMQEGKELFGDGNFMYQRNSVTGKVEDGFYCGLSDDVSLNIQPMSYDISEYQDCLIDGNANRILPLGMHGHVHAFQQILNLLLISNREVCEDYLSYPMDIGFFVQKYLPFLRFQINRNGSMILTQSIYREKNITEAQRNFHEFLLDNRYIYPSFLHKIETVDDAECKDLRASLAYLERRYTDDVNRGI